MHSFTFIRTRVHTHTHTNTFLQHAGGFVNIWSDAQGERADQISACLSKDAVIGFRIVGFKIRRCGLRMR